MSVVGVTGCSGYIGSRLMHFMETDDAVSRIVGVDVAAPGQHGGGKLEFHRMDVRDPGLAALFKERAVDTVIHLAFILDPVHDEKLMHEVDVGGADNVLRAAAACGAGHVVVASSTTAFGAFPDNPEWLTEDDPVRLHSAYYYSAHKYEVEMLCEDFTGSNPAVRLALVRPCFVLGPNVENFISRFMLRLPAIPGISGARPEIQFVHEDDVAEVFMRVLERRAAGRFHAVGEGTVGLGRLAEMAGKRLIDLPAGFARSAVDLLWRLHAPLVEGPGGMLDFIRYRWCASDLRTRQALGISSMRPAEDVLRCTFETKRAARRSR